MFELSKHSPQGIVGHVAGVHDRERALIQPLSDEQIRAASALPGWSRGHVLAARLAFLEAAIRQIEYVLDGRSIEFYDGGKPGREAEVERHSDRPGAELIRAVEDLGLALDAAWSRLGPSDWELPVSYREGGPMTKLLLASWREAELHLVDFDLGVSPAGWTREFCLHLFDFLALRVPEGVLLEFRTPGGEVWTLGMGQPVCVTGALTDLAAWLAGRASLGPVESSTGALPRLRGLGDAQRARRGQ
ncbi:maleylpyruvate isomerase family mycothiol-dependent enzyme [Streptomyces sp. NBC_00243]|uniref:maleylpyruvate isomerase family mycothiol-dependent enzyme n=1 Tax=Streptomyces sp. NBC_00243 TaxID=2975688 RepID=UPI002DD85191|nr:maleylpyruvate isomerase family mycothiol-dependent enzyme [Streptomyces sp. NBC_00243]WRZ17343.1 maleylpyruvate isomerase family mycothiol-dependent enzyme [Streptomyces sp. NBC_00243]